MQAVLTRGVRNPMKGLLKIPSSTITLWSRLKITFRHVMSCMERGGERMSLSYASLSQDGTVHISHHVSLVKKTYFWLREQWLDCYCHKPATLLFFLCSLPNPFPLVLSPFLLSAYVPGNFCFLQMPFYPSSYFLLLRFWHCSGLLLRTFYMVLHDNAHYIM